MKKNLLFVLLAFVSLNAISQIPTNGLIGYWPLNGNANDSTGNGYNGVVTGAVTSSDRFGDPAGAYLFTDSTKFITVTDAAPLRLSNTDYTISCWVYQNNILSNQEAILTKRANGSQNGYILNVTGVASSSPGHVNFQVSGGIDPRLGSDSIIALASWHHIAIVYTLSNLQMKIYIDGVLNNDTIGMPSPNAAATADLLIGKDGATGGYGFHGKIDDVAMYNRALSFSEVYLIASFCNTVDIANNIVAQYNFAGDANDNSGNNHNGTVSGAALTTDRFGNANYAYSFNGSNATITVPDHVALRLSNTDYTISTWINQTAQIATNATILSKRNGSGQNGYVLSLSGSTGVPPYRTNFNVSGGTDPKAVSDSAVSAGTWHHLVIVYELSNQLMLTYVDGLLNNVKTNMPSPNAATSVNMSLGSDGGVYAFNGKLDDFRIYNRSLSSCDIDSLYNMPDPMLSGINDLSGVNAIQIFPNPATDQISMSGTITAKVDIRNAPGQLVKSTTIHPGNNVISLTDLKSGLYFVTVIDENNNVAVQKLIKY